MSIATRGYASFREHVELARREGARILVAFVHWGEEWHFQPTDDQRLAARDMIDAGFDLVIGSHVHVLNPAEIYQGKLIAYSLGNVLSAFEPLEVRTSAVLDVDLGVPSTGSPTLRDFRYRPTLALTNSRHRLQVPSHTRVRERRKRTCQGIGPCPADTRRACRGT